MYKVYCDGKALHDARDEEYRLLSPKLTLELNKTGNFDFGILPSHPGIGNIERLKSSIGVYDDAELLYSGRPITDEADFYNLGQVLCEGELSFLLDSVQRPCSYGTHAGNGKTNVEIFRKLIEAHNNQVEDEKRFEIGIIDIDSVEVKSISTNYEKTWDFLNSNFIEKYDGYLRVRYRSGHRYLDYVKRYGKVSTQEIRFGENLLDLKRYIKADNLVTAIIPVGKNNVTIKTANGHNGTDYVYDSEAVGLYGWIYEKVDFSDVNDPDTLLKKAKEELKSRINLAISIELTAADLHLIDVDINAIRLGDLVPCISERHSLLSTPGDVSTYYLVSKYELNLDNPSNNKITLGRTISTLTAQVAGTADTSGRLNAVAQIASDAAGSANQAAEKAEEIGRQIDELTDKFYPVGSILQTMDKNYDPQIRLGGTWKRIKGRVLVGVDESDADFNVSDMSGGAKSVTLSLANMPAHNHSGTAASGGSHTHSGTAASGGGHAHGTSENGWGFLVDGGGTGRGRRRFANSSSGVYVQTNTNIDLLGWRANTSTTGAHTHSVTADSAGAHTHSVSTVNQGSGTAHSNLQPYTTCYIWTRTA